MTIKAKACEKISDLRWATCFYDKGLRKWVISGNLMVSPVDAYAAATVLESRISYRVRVLPATVTVQLPPEKRKKAMSHRKAAKGGRE